MRLTRIGNGPIIGPDTPTSGEGPPIGVNINGPSLMRVPDWLPDPLGIYYLYFADHMGEYIRLAYANDLAGPWTIHAPGSLQLADSCCMSWPASLASRSPRSTGAEFRSRLGATSQMG